MLFSSLIFLVVFLPCVLLVYYALLGRHRHLQNYFLLVASLGFYAWGEPWFVLVMMLSIVGNYCFGLLVERFRWAKLIIALSLVFNLSIIFIFKYLMFTLENLNLLLSDPIKVPVIELPIGISFFTFQAISYVIDVYRGKGKAQKNLLNVGLYISLFPQLIAGPIVRYETIADQIENRRESFDDFSIGVCRFLVGFSKKVLLANNFAVMADKAFGMAGTDYFSSGFAWLGAIAYTLQIYYDFSGYSDMAIGLGRMFGFKFLENFNYPYISRSVSEFWRRWHISLGSWFRDYVYFPLGGSRVNSKARLVFNLFVVWFLTGLWHGANWTFICWGLMYFVLISCEKVLGLDKRIKAIDDATAVARAATTASDGSDSMAATTAGTSHRHLKNACLHLYTMFFVVIGWVLFRAETIGDAFTYLSAMFGNSSVEFFDKFFLGYVRENWCYLFFGILFSMPVASKVRGFIEGKLAGSRIGSGVFAVLYAVVLVGGLIIACSYIIKGAYNPFIYFNF